MAGTDIPLDVYDFSMDTGSLTPSTPGQAPDAAPATLTPGGVNRSSAANNHLYPDGHAHATHATGVPDAEPMTGYSDTNQGRGD